MTDWILAASADAIPPEDVMRVNHGGHIYALYRDEKGDWFASDGLCTHEHVDLTEGFVFDNVIECPRHQGRFDVRTGRAMGAPVCIDLKTYPVKVEGGQVYIRLG
jgi:3-phenylpropionate/trans-cinnamate dioxygenase ferredoxin component